MKIGILSFHNAKNFGAVLQNYALQKAINALGYESITIDFRNKDETNTENTKYTNQKDESYLKNFLRDVFLFVNKKKIDVRNDSFEKFVKRNIYLSKKCDSDTISELADCFDVYICGSDQVWNKDICPTDFYIYALNYVHTKPKAAYAASAGSGDINDERLLSYIKQMDYITVREHSLESSLKCKGIECNTVCDPTILLKKNKWLDVIKNIYPHTFGGGLIYYIDDEIGDVCSQIARDYGNGRKIYNPVPVSKQIIKHHQTSIFQDGPLEFLADVQAADFIVTSSFHGTVFSIIFEKNFIAVPYGNRGQRLIDLLEEVELGGRMVSSFEEYLERKNQFNNIDYSNVRDRIQIMRENGLKELSIICDLA